MKTPLLAVALVLATALLAGNACSRSSSMKHSQDAAPDAPKGAGGVPGGSGGGGSVGVAGAAGIGGPDAGAGGSIPDGPSDLSLGTGGSADANRDVATSPGTGGAAGSGGRGGSGGAAGGVAGTGGATGAGGVTGRGGGGGASGAGGKTGTGGATGKGGSSGVDGGATEYLCAYECRADASGVTGWYSGSELICTADCLGRTARCLYVGTRSEGCYADSTSAGCDSSYNGLIAWTTCGVLPGDTGYLAWQAPGVAGTGPAVVVYGRDGAIKWWTNTAAFPPETPPYSITTPSEGLTRLEVGDLFRRLEAVDMASLPHAPLATNGCSASLYLRPCDTCTPTTLSYGSPESLTPEMESVWSWFDTILGDDGRANPRYFCASAGADP